MLQINNKLRIVRLDEKNLGIEQLKIIKSKKKGDYEQWLCVGFYGTLKSALQGVINKQLFDCIEEEIQIKDLVNRIEKIEKEILRVIKEQ